MQKKIELRRQLLAKKKKEEERKERRRMGERKKDAQHMRHCLPPLATVSTIFVVGLGGGDVTD